MAHIRVQHIHTFSQQWNKFFYADIGKKQKKILIHPIKSYTTNYPKSKPSSKTKFNQHNDKKPWETNLNWSLSVTISCVEQRKKRYSSNSIDEKYIHKLTTCLSSQMNFFILTLTSLSKRCAALCTLASESAESLQSASKIWLKNTINSPLTTCRAEIRKLWPKSWHPIKKFYINMKKW